MTASQYKPPDYTSGGLATHISLAQYSHTVRGVACWVKQLA